ncbi:MAG: DegT/DnrJ/EryC1/StrS family aminotransferase [Patescibacteria group bacterium]|jgi:perosamine synthetase
MKKFPVAKPFIDQNDISEVVKVMKSGVLSLGPKYIKFENDIAKYAGTKYACAVSNGTCGLHLAVKALNLRPGDEVITSPFSFISSSNCLLFERVVPKFVDIQETTFNMDPAYLEKSLTKKTKAILVVHIFGQSADMTEITRFAKRHNLRIIEDSCESLGSTYKEKMTGTIGDVGVYAFYPNKQMTTGEGGILVTNSKKIRDMCVSLRNQGRNTRNDWLVHERMGYNYRIDEMSASLGVTQLKKLNWMINEKRKIASWYSAALGAHPSIRVPVIGAKRTHSWFVYVIRLINGSRDAVMEKLETEHISTKPYLPVIHLQPFMKKKFGYRPGSFPIAEKISSQTLALPFYIGLTRADVAYISKKIINATEKYD